MDQILKGKKKKRKLSGKKADCGTGKNSSDRHKKEWKMEEKNIIISPSIAPGIKIIE